MDDAQGTSKEYGPGLNTFTPPPALLSIIRFQSISIVFCTFSPTSNGAKALQWSISTAYEVAPCGAMGLEDFCHRDQSLRGREVQNATVQIASATTSVQPEKERNRLRKGEVMWSGKIEKTGVKLFAFADILVYLVSYRYVSCPLVFSISLYSTCNWLHVESSSRTVA